MDPPCAELPAPDGPDIGRHGWNLDAFVARNRQTLNGQAALL